MPETITYSGTLTVESCGVCAIRFAMPVDFKQRRLDDHSLRIWCPAGHCIGYSGKTKAQRLQVQLDAASKRETRLYNSLEGANRQTQAAERSAAAHKGAHTKTKKRIRNGVCTLCHRSFKNVKRHMDDQHPEESDAQREPAPTQQRSPRSRARSRGVAGQGHG